MTELIYEIDCSVSVKKTILKLLAKKDNGRVNISIIQSGIHPVMCFALDSPRHQSTSIREMPNF